MVRKEETEGLSIRAAQRTDTALILSFIKELAAYEKMEQEVVATEQLLEEWVFDKECAEVLVAEMNGNPVGFALYFSNFSTFLGRGGLYLEDLYVRPAARGKGVGKAMLVKLCKIARLRGCGRVEWWCLKWNRPSIDFYHSLGAEEMSDWQVFRLDQDAITRLTEE